MTKIGLMAITGLMGLSLASTPVMAADNAKEGDTNVSYISNSTEVDQDGRIIMVIPADVTLTKSSLNEQMKLSLRRIDGLNLPKDFNAQTQINSKNEGILKSATQTALDSEYNILNTDGSEIKAGLLTDKDTFTDFHTFTENTGSKKEVSFDFKAEVEQGDSERMEAAPSGTAFSDTLTFKVSSMSGTGLNFK